MPRADKPQTWAEPLACAQCGADWRNHEAGPPYKREIGVEVRGVYDGVLYYVCPDCKAEYPRPHLLKQYDAFCLDRELRTLRLEQDIDDAKT